MIAFIPLLPLSTIFILYTSIVDSRPVSYGTFPHGARAAAKAILFKVEQYHFENKEGNS